MPAIAKELTWIQATDIAGSRWGRRGARERMEAIVETMEILANPEAMKAIAQHRTGKVKFRSLAILRDE